MTRRECSESPVDPDANLHPLSLRRGQVKWLRRAAISLSMTFVLAVSEPLQAAKMNFSISGGYFEDDQNQRIVEATPVEQSILFQLINLGPNGEFDPIPEGAWVGGDDVLIDLSIDGSGAVGDAFSIGGFSKFISGGFSRSFSIEETPGIAPSGAAVGLRWFPAKTIAQKQSGALPSGGEVYGQIHLEQKYSFPSDPSRSAWFLPATTVTLTSFDPSVSPDFQVDNPSFVTTPGFTGEPLFTVVSNKPWRVGELLDSSDEDLGGGEILRRSLYKVTKAGAIEYRLVKEWFSGGTTEGDPVHYEAILADTWIITNFDPVSLTAIEATLQSNGFTSQRSSVSTWFISAGIVDPETRTAVAIDGIQEAIQSLLRSAHSSAITVYPNRVGFTQSSSGTVVPNDTQYASQVALAGLGAAEAWSLSTGSSSLVVGVLDTGIDTNHPDLVANLWSNPNETEFNGQDDDMNGLLDDIIGWDFVENDNDPQDQDGHGTQMSGIIGAVGDNGQGIAGVNWDVKLLTLKCGVSQLSELNIVSAIDYAIALKNDGVPIVALNHSYKILSSDAPTVDTPLKMAVDRAETAGILMVAAAGNDGKNSDLNGTSGQSYCYPADYPSVLAIASVDDAGVLAGDSNFGATSVELAAPGVSVISTVDGGGYASASGTSQAAAFVSGAAALAQSYNGGIDLRRLKRLLIGSVAQTPELSGKVETGGQLSLERLLHAAVQDEWAETRWGVNYLDDPDAALAEDPDADGLSNLGEFKLGTDPLLADVATQRERNQLTADGLGGFTFKFSVDPDACIVEAIPQVSVDLGDVNGWNAIPEEAILSLGVNGTTGLFEYQTTFDDVSSVPQRFMRLTFDGPPLLDF